MVFIHCLENHDVNQDAKNNTHPHGSSFSWLVPIKYFLGNLLWFHCQCSRPARNNGFFTNVLGPGSYCILCTTARLPSLITVSTCIKPQIPHFLRRDLGRLLSLFFSGSPFPILLLGPCLLLWTYKFTFSCSVSLWLSPYFAGPSGYLLCFSTPIQVYLFLKV